VDKFSLNRKNKYIVVWKLYPKGVLH